MTEATLSFEFQSVRGARLKLEGFPSLKRCRIRRLDYVAASL
jgi:hypothetical protein